MARRPTPWYRQARNAWYVQIDGRQVNLGPDKKAAFDRFYALMQQPKEQTVRSDSLAAITDAFLEWVTNNRSPDTYEWYRYRLQRFIERYPNLRADELRPYHVETWADSYNFSITSRRNYLRSVKRCLKWATKQGYIDRNPIVDLEVPRGEHKEICVSPDEYVTLLSYVRNATLKDLIEVTWETGCRPQESLRVEARHVDVVNQRWVFSKSESKGKRVSRVVYMTDKSMAITKRLVEAHPSGRLFCNANCKPWTPDSVNTAFDAIQVRMGKDRMKVAGEEILEKEIVAKIKTLCPTKNTQGETRDKTQSELRTEAKQKLTSKRAKQQVQRYSLYALRHSWATHALRNGLDPLTVAILMGHKDPSMLANVYQHLALSTAHMLDQARRAAV